MVFFYRAKGGRCFTGMLKSDEKMLEGIKIVGWQNFPTTPQNRMIRKHLIDRLVWTEKSHDRYSLSKLIVSSIYPFLLLKLEIFTRT